MQPGNANDTLRLIGIEVRLRIPQLARHGGAGLHQPRGRRGGHATLEVVRGLWVDVLTNPEASPDEWDWLPVGPPRLPDSELGSVSVIDDDGGARDVYLFGFDNAEVPGVWISLFGTDVEDGAHRIVSTGGLAVVVADLRREEGPYTLRVVPGRTIRLRWVPPTPEPGVYLTLPCLHGEHDQCPSTWLARVKGGCLCACHIGEPGDVEGARVMRRKPGS